MIWSSLFLINVVQGIFLISLIVYNSRKNPVASRLIIALLALIVFINLDYLIVRTSFRYSLPQVFGAPFGMVLLFGPLLYFYSKSVIENSFQWKKTYWLHFIPYFLQLIINIPWFLNNKNDLNWYIDLFLSGNMAIRDLEKVTFAGQDLQLFIYLFLTFRLIRSAANSYGNVTYITPLSSRIKWLKELSLCFSLFLFTAVSLYIFVIVNGKYNPVSNYIYTIVTSCIIYFIAYKLVLNPDLISPDFTTKYRTYMDFIGEEGEKYIQKLRSLMTESKVYTDPDLKLALLAEKLGLPSHQVSKLINEKFGKSYNDFVNEYRVHEFISRVNNKDFKSFSIYGIALDVGFNSKSSFNIAFKKITGKNPSDYKNPL